MWSGTDSAVFKNTSVIKEYKSLDFELQTVTKQKSWLKLYSFPNSRKSYFYKTLHSRNTYQMPAFYFLFFYF